MTKVNLGEVPVSKDRDAIHIAVIPVIAGQFLSPSERVRIVDGFAYYDDEAPTGIVDPFLTQEVEEGKSFWLFLMPETITDIRHHWTHPAFDIHTPKYSKEESEKWLRKFCAEKDCPSFEVLIAGAIGTCPQAEFLNSYHEQYLHFNEFDAHGSIPIDFWIHVENYTGQICPIKAKYFSCSC